MPAARRGWRVAGEPRGGDRAGVSRLGLVAVAVVDQFAGRLAGAIGAAVPAHPRSSPRRKGIPVFAFAEDVAASGGYWLALAGDEIFAEETSLLGSIGVISASFGFYQLIERLGIERRLYTAGERKSLLDPFLPEDPSDVARLSALAAGHPRQLKEHVRRRRAGKIDPATSGCSAAMC